MTDGDVTLTIGSRAISGWTHVRVTRGIERCPSDFEIGLTELYPTEAEALTVQAGDACMLSLGSDPVVTGYVDQFVPGLSASSHDIHIRGRGKCADLVDCSAEWDNAQISGSSVYEVAQKIAAPYGISVERTVQGLRPIPQFNFMLGETGWDIIERLARWSQVVAYDEPDGNLLLAQVGTRATASGFVQGQNVESASVTYSMNQRFKYYIGLPQSFLSLRDVNANLRVDAFAGDPNCTRHRTRIILVETPYADQSITQQRVEWEMNRRAGRSTVVQLTCDSWRDSAGDLWAPNTLAQVSLPMLKLGPQTSSDAPGTATLLIAEVTFRLDESGTHADITLMPPTAFSPDPTPFIPQNADVLATS